MFNVSCINNFDSTISMDLISLYVKNIIKGKQILGLRLSLKLSNLQEINDNTTSIVYKNIDQCTIGPITIGFTVV